MRLILKLLFILGLFCFHKSSSEVVNEGVINEEENEDSGISEVDEEQSDVEVKDSQKEELVKNMSDLIKYVVLFPEYPDFVLTAGKPVRVLITLKNLVNEQKTLKHIYASLHHPKKASHSMQNFSTIHYDLVLPKDTEMSVQYNFWPHHSFADRSFYLIIYALITDNETDHHLYVYNATHIFSEMSVGIIDFQLISILVLIFSGIIGISYAIYIRYFKHHTFTKTHQSRKVIEVGTKSECVDYNWLPKECLTNINEKSKPTNKKKIS